MIEQHKSVKITVNIMTTVHIIPTLDNPDDQLKIIITDGRPKQEDKIEHLCGSINNSDHMIVIIDICKGSNGYSTSISSTKINPSSTTNITPIINNNGDVILVLTPDLYNEIKYTHEYLIKRKHGMRRLMQRTQNHQSNNEVIY